MAKRKKAAKADYEVGRGKPPKASQYKPGESGNRKGRPPKEKRHEFTSRIEDIHAALAYQMMEPIEFKENGEFKTLPSIILLIRKIKADAIQGNFRCQKLLLNLYLSVLTDQYDKKMEFLTFALERECITLEEAEAASEKW